MCTMHCFFWFRVTFNFANDAFASDQMFTKFCIKSEGGGVVSFGSLLLVDY